MKVEFEPSVMVKLLDPTSVGGRWGSGAGQAEPGGACSCGWAAATARTPHRCDDGPRRFDPGPRPSAFDHWRATWPPRNPATLEHRSLEDVSTLRLHQPFSPTPFVQPPSPIPLPRRLTLDQLCFKDGDIVIAQRAVAAGEPGVRFRTAPEFLEHARQETWGREEGGGRLHVDAGMPVHKWIRNGGERGPSCVRPRFHRLSNLPPPPPTPLPPTPPKPCRLPNPAVRRQPAGKDISSDTVGHGGGAGWGGVQSFRDVCLGGGEWVGAVL
jgi:hypothetical protein